MERDLKLLNGLNIELIFSKMLSCSDGINASTRIGDHAMKDSSLKKKVNLLWNFLFYLLVRCKARNWKLAYL